LASYCNAPVVWQLHKMCANYSEEENIALT
jgi:hypothetical protein